MFAGDVVTGVVHDPERTMRLVSVRPVGADVEGDGRNSGHRGGR